MAHATVGNFVWAGVGWAVLVGWTGLGQTETVQAAGPLEPVLAVALCPAVVGWSGQTEGLPGRAAGSSSEPPAAGAGEHAAPGPLAQAAGPPSRTLRVQGEVGVHPVDRQAACRKPNKTPSTPYMNN